MLKKEILKTKYNQSSPLYRLSERSVKVAKTRRINEEAGI